MRFTRPLGTLALLVGLWVGSAPQAVAVPGSTLTGELALIARARQGLVATVAYMRQNPDIFPRHAPARLRVLDASQRREARDLWTRFLDYQLVLDAAWQRLHQAGEAGVADADRTAYAAFLARYRYALDFIALADADPALRTVLDEAVPELGLPAGTYSDFKFRFLNVGIATEFAVQAARNLSGTAAPLADSMRDDEQRIWRAGKGDGALNTLRNAGQMLGNGARRLVFPIQKEVSEWMGDTRVAQGDRFLVAPDQISGLAGRLQPGDILLERREWYLSNIGLPGFWPHAALYVGTPAERSRFFDDPAVAAWLKGLGIDEGGLEALLRTRYPEAYRAGMGPGEHGAPYRILEAMSEGVVFTTLEHSAYADAVAVLRPRLSRLEVAKALARAFAFQGRPYDFDFDFRTDATVVCTELVYKAYAPDTDKKGLDLPLRSVAGRPVVTANDLVQQFDATFQTPAQQFDLITFLDGQARLGRAVQADVAAFRASWRRPKWHILTQETDFAAP